MSYKKLTETAIIGAYSPAELKELKDALTNTALIKKSVIDSFKYKEQIDTIRKRFNYSSKVLTLSLLEKVWKRNRISLKLEQNKTLQ